MMLKVILVTAVTLYLLGLIKLKWIDKPKPDQAQPIVPSTAPEMAQERNVPEMELAASRVVDLTPLLEKWRKK